jgi:hypothetical protein
MDRFCLSGRVDADIIYYECHNYGIVFINIIFNRGNIRKSGYYVKNKQADSDGLNGIGVLLRSARYMIYTLSRGKTSAFENPVNLQHSNIALNSKLANPNL